MQSGISASQDLQAAFNTLVSSPNQRALIATIENETLVPQTTIPLEAQTLELDLHLLQPHLSPTQAAYILLKTHPGASDGYAAITFVPNAAPVRQKMLSASTRLTLVRELGIERFRETIFATEMDELTAQGWAKHEAHTALSAPLTEEETALKGVKDAEGTESQGTTGRRGHVSGRVDVKTAEGVVEALGLLREEGCKGTLVQLKYTLPGEVLTLESSTDGVSPADVGNAISATEPRYSFYSMPSSSGSAAPAVVFIYTCPTASKIKERMIYSTGKSWTRIVAERDAGLTIAKSLEATDPTDLAIDEAVSGGDGEAASGASTPSVDSKPTNGGFARPKRPGRR
ncbi:Hypothetical protein R9X50_00582900 [Acrodontium crateriforme]|uniref:ADF-H domain-containing protein n=1 Tax=Acrodontium crateriforme TaxID=150365 RepID=A0AAQ3MCX4_9PEZI|nr:Hypothetical protein R9X50_00582900 [Acrodontium crateriforme]